MKENSTNTLVIKNLDTINALNDLITIFSKAFESTYTTTEEYLGEMLRGKTAILLGAFLKDTVVGGLVAFEIMPIHGSREIYIYDIAVHPKYQRRSIGKKLIDYLKVEAKARNIDTIFVEAESEDEDAVMFYRSIGGEEIMVNHFNFKL